MYRRRVKKIILWGHGDWNSDKSLDGKNHAYEDRNKNFHGNLYKNYPCYPWQRMCMLLIHALRYQEAKLKGNLQCWRDMKTEKSSRYSMGIAARLRQTHGANYEQKETSKLFRKSEVSQNRNRKSS